MIVHVHAILRHFNFFMQIETPTIVVKRYAVREAKKNAECSMQGQNRCNMQYARGCHPPTSKEIQSVRSPIATRFTKDDISL